MSLWKIMCESKSDARNYCRYFSPQSGPPPTIATVELSQALVLPRIYSTSFDVQFTLTNFAWNRFEPARCDVSAREQPKHSLINHEMRMINLRNEQIICNFMQSLDSYRRRLPALVKFQFSSNIQLSSHPEPPPPPTPSTRELSLMKIELHQEQVEIKHESTEQMRINCRKKFVTFFPDIIRKICMREMWNVDVEEWEKR